jgi:DNA-binding CsgD family transcriptional regulator/Tfp pilus assembly protein PilF
LRHELHRALRTGRALRRPKALASGAPTSAVIFLRRALEEPPTAAATVEVLLGLGTAEMAAGDDSAAGHFRTALGVVAEPARRAEIHKLLGLLFYQQGQLKEAAAEFDRGLAELAAQSSDTAMDLRALYVNAARLDAELREKAMGRLQTILEHREQVPRATERAALAATAVEYVYGGTHRNEARELALRALADGTLLREETSDSITLYVVTGVLSWCDDYNTPIATLTQALDDARQRGAIMAFATASFCRAGPLYYLGDLSAAAADAQQALSATAHGWEIFVLGAAGLLALAQLERGDFSAAEKALDIPDADSKWANSVPLAFFLEARGRLRLAGGAVESALNDFLASGAAATSSMVVNPAIVPWRSGAALAAAALGQSKEAQRLATEELQLASGFGAPRPLAEALRVAGLVSRGHQRIEFLQRAAEVVADSPALLERAQVLAAMGREMRILGQREAALRALRQSFALTARCGAVLLGREVREELLAAGAKPRRAALTGPEALTPMERRVSTMVASGLTNKEVAQSLFVTVKAVEWHLAHAYQKLGITSRRELAKSLGDRFAATPSAVSVSD